MGQRGHHHNKRQAPRTATPRPEVARPTPAAERAPPVTYGKPFILLEDGKRATFIFNAGQWVSHGKSIAEYRLDSRVEQLSQKINGMARYEVCAPVSLTK